MNVPINNSRRRKERRKSSGSSLYQWQYSSLMEICMACIEQKVSEIEELAPPRIIVLNGILAVSRSKLVRIPPLINPSNLAESFPDCS